MDCSGRRCRYGRLRDGEGTCPSRLRLARAPNSVVFGTAQDYAVVQFISFQGDDSTMPRVSMVEDPCRDMFIRVLEPCFNEQEKAKQIAGSGS